MSDVSSKESWVPPHTKIYNRLLADIVSNPPTGTAGEFLRDRAPAMLRQSFGEPFGWAVSGKKITFRQVSDGEPCLYWNGAAFESRPFSEVDHYVGEYLTFGRRLIELAASVGGEPLLVDLGAGTCMQAVALRSLGCNLPILNLDFFGLAIGQQLTESLGLSNMLFGAVDINGALAHQDTTAGLKDIILSTAAGRPIIAFSRVAVFGFYSAPEYERLMEFVINGIGAVAGLHVEACGHLTQTFQYMQREAKGKLQIAPKCLAADGDLFAYLESRTDIKVTQREEVWPHFIHTRFHSSLAWRKV